MKLHAFSKVNLSLYLPIDQYITLVDLSSHVMLFPFQYLIHILYRCSFLTFSWRSISPIIGTYFQILTLCCDYYLYIYMKKKIWDGGQRGDGKWRCRSYNTKIQVGGVMTHGAMVRSYPRFDNWMYVVPSSTWHMLVHKAAL